MGLLVQDLLLLSRLDAGRLELAHQRIALPDLLAEVLRQAGRLADERGISMTLATASGVAWGDPARVRQVLLILIDNALRHTRPGGAVQLAAEPQGHGVRISVADTGCGIAPEHLAHIFERFYRADNARGATGGGSGLGLSIAKMLIEAQGGQIAIESQVGKGTTVVVWLPAAGE